jgi:hypothetical protein
VNIYEDTALRRTLLFGVPAVYFALTIMHPTENPTLGDDVGVWMVIHVVQLFLIGGMSCIIWVLTAGSTGTAARVGRAFILPYAITYSAFDAMAGLAAGALVRVANEADPAGQAEAQRIVDRMGETEPAGVVFYVVLGLCWLAAMGGAVLSLRGRIPTGAFVLLALGTVVFALGHPRPVGPTGMGLILAGMVWMELWPRRPEASQVERDQSPLAAPTART